MGVSTNVVCVSRRLRQVEPLTPAPTPVPPVPPELHPHRHHHGEPHNTTETFQTDNAPRVYPSSLLPRYPPSFPSSVSSVTSPQPDTITSEMPSSEASTAARDPDTTLDTSSTNTYTTEVCRYPLYHACAICMLVFSKSWYRPTNLL